jgi:AcrR family transcriptional regulator
MKTREKILKAAAEMIADDVTATLSVRAVAARAGVSTGSLRFHFPTQRALQDEVLTRIYQHFMPDDPILDRSLPARDRLVNCLRQVLAPGGVGDDARRSFGLAYEAFIAPAPSEQVRAAYLGYERASAARVTYWLSTLDDEGSVPPGDRAKDVRFLLTVLNGLSLERALPYGDSVLQSETDTLYTAVDAVLGTSAWRAG